jgi:hypothetical protein
VASVDHAPATTHGGGQRRALCPRRGSFPFGRGGGAVPRPLPESFFSDAPEKVRIEIKRDDAATVAAHFAGGPVSFFALCL